mgnify:CR=1 FL=1
MKPLLSLAAQSLWSRRLTSGLTILSIALSVALLLGIESVRTGARESFSNTISGVDLIAGARGGSLQLLLYTVFRLGSATNNIRYETYQRWAQHPAVAWTIPYSLGDSHRGFRVVVAADAICGSTDQTHDAVMTLYASRFGEQVELAEAAEILAEWRAT